MFYRNTLAAVKATIEEIAPGTNPEKTELISGQPASLSYILYMAKEVENMSNPYKAGRWIGWMFAHIELRGIWKNDRSRELAKLDSNQGLDRPTDFLDLA